MCFIRKETQSNNAVFRLLLRKPSSLPPMFLKDMVQDTDEQSDKGLGGSGISGVYSTILLVCGCVH